MSADETLSPAIRRSPAAAFEQQKLHTSQHHHDWDDTDDHLDEATPPPIARSRSSCIDTQPSSQTRPAASNTSVNPLSSHPVEPAPPIPPRHKFHYPYREKPQDVRSEPPPPPPSPPTTTPPCSRRSPRGLVSYRTNKKIPLHLRRQPSLETIDSVTTTASEDHLDPPEAEAPSPDWFTQEDDPSPTSVSTSRAPSTYASSTSSKRSSTPGATPLETPLEFTSLGRHSPQSLFRKMMPRKTEDVAPSSPTRRLIIEKSTSIDRTTNPSTLSRSTTSLASENRSNSSLPLAPASSGRTLNTGLLNVERNRSESSSEWSASSFDISSLTEAELKKCKKKGINPALYAEMRAARGKKWTSPIAGNTFL